MDGQTLEIAEKIEDETDQTIVHTVDAKQKTDDSLDSMLNPVAVKKQEEVIKRPYELRDLKDKDLFPMLQILKEIGIKDYKNAFIQAISEEGEEESEEKSEEKDKKRKDAGIKIAFDMADILISNLLKVEDKVYALWSDISGISADEIREMEFGTLPLMIMDTFSKARNSSFFMVLSKFLS